MDNSYAIGLVLPERRDLINVFTLIVLFDTFSPA
jgi:hypothetical protein